MYKASVTRKGTKVDLTRKAIEKGLMDGLVTSALEIRSEAVRNLRGRGGAKKAWDTGRLATSQHVKAGDGRTLAQPDVEEDRMDDVVLNANEVAVGGGPYYAWYVHNGFTVTQKTANYFLWMMRYDKSEGGGATDTEKWRRLYAWAKRIAPQWIAGNDYLYKAYIATRGSIVNNVEKQINKRLARIK